MKDLCRICARELCGNQRRWIFHPASKLNLQVLLSHALGRELTRDGKGEFACSKCTFMLDRMYRFDTVIARVEALSIERLHRLLLEKDRLRQCIGGLYRKNNCDEPAPRPVADSKGSECTVDISGLHDAKYNALLQDDLTYSVYESWAEHEEQVVESHHHHHCPMSEVSGPHRSRKCRGCAALRVADSDYEAVCRVPRKLARSISCGPSTRYSASVCSEDPSGAATLVPESLPTTSESDRTLIDTDAERGSGSSSMESLDTAVDVSRPSAREGDADRDMKEDMQSESLSEEPVCLRDSKLDLALNLAKSCEYRPVQSPRGSKLPILLKPVSPESMVFCEPGLQTPYSMGCESSPCLPELSLPQTQSDLLLELSELDKLWQDTYMEYKPIGFHQNLIEEQQSQLNQYECATGRCVNELQKAQLQVQSLQVKIQESETENWRLQEKLYEMESELRAVKQAAQKQERTIQSLNNTISSNSSEAEELLRVIEGQKNMLCELKETVNRHHLETLQGTTAQPPPLQAELLALQSSLFSTQLELQGSQRAQRQTLRQVTDVTCTRDRLQSDLQEALKHWDATEKHNQEMRGALKQARADLLERKGQVMEKDRQRQMEVEARDKTITQLRQTLRDKQQLLQDYSELLEHQQDPSQTRDAMLDKLKSRIKDRDRALERAIDEKFRCLEEREGEVRRLQLALREKEMDQEKLRCVLSNNEETILHLDRLAQGKQLQVEQMSAVSRNAQQLRQQAEERLGCSVRERDSIISQLQASLHTHSQEAQGLRDAVLSKSPAGSAALLEQLTLQLQLKENLFQRLLSDRSSQAQQHQAELQELLHTLSNRDQCMQDCAARLGQVISQQTQELQELRRQLRCKEREVRELSREKEQQGWDPQLEIKRLQSQLQEKEAFIQELMQDSPPCQEEPMITSRPKEEPVRGRSHKGRGPQRDMQAVQEELQLVLKKEKVAQMELCSLRSALAQHKEEMQTQAAELEVLTRTVSIKELLVKDLQTQLVEPSGLPLVDRLTQELQELRETVAKQGTTGTDPQSTLEQLISDYSKLNDALKTEKQLYLNLTQMHSSRDSEKSRTLQVELGRVEALRAQLEDALRRVRDSASAPQRAAKPPADSGEFCADEEDDDDASSEGTDIVEEEYCAQLTAESLASSQDVGLTCPNRGLEGRMLSQHTTKDGQALAKVQKLLEQKQIVEHELGELKFQLEKAGYTSLSQMRTVLLSLRMQTNEASWQNEQPIRRKQEAGDAGGRSGGRQQRCFPEEEQEEEEDDDEEQGSVTAEWMEVGGELSSVQGKHSAPYLQLREGHGKRRCSRPLSLDLGALLLQQAENTCTQEAELGKDVGGFWQDVEEGLREKALRLHSDLALSRQESRHLQERLMVSEATVQAQAEQLKDFRELLTETSVQQDSKHVQVDLQDLGYETCGRSENEAEREGASSPEFDDLEMCTALSREDSGQEWWSGNCGKGEDVMSLQRRVEELRSQLSRSQATIRSLQSQMRSLSTTSDYASSLERPRKVNWGFQASSAHSGLEEDEGWQSDGLGTPRSRHSLELQELVARVASLEDQLKTSRPEGKKAVEDAKSASWPGKFDSLIQAQARELSHLRQRLRDGRGVCHILTQHLGDTTKSFEELLRANDIDYYMGQSFREQLAQSSALVERISAKITGREQSELPDDKMGHELLAIRLSKELQQKDKIIESLRSKLKQERSDTPSSSHALSDTSDQSDRTSFVSDDQGSTHKDLDLCSDFDAASEYAEEGRPSPRQQTQTDSHCHAGTTPKHSSLSSSSPALHGAQSTVSCPSMPCTQHTPVDSPGQKGLCPGPMSSSLPPPQTHNCPDLSGQRAPFLPDPHSALLRPGFHSAGAFSLAEVHQELQMLQRQLGETERFAVPHPHVKALSGFPLAGHAHPPNLSSCAPLYHHAFPQHGFTTPGANPALKADSNLLQGSALWDMTHISRPIRASTFGDVSSGSSGYQSGTNHTGVDLIEEHLKEVRSLRQRLEDSIRTNDRLRQQLEDRLGTTGRDGGASTNIYIQGLDSVSQLSNENRALKEENLGLHSQLRQSNKEECKEAEQLRAVVAAARARLKQAEQEVEQWKEESRRLQARSSEQVQEVQQLRQDRHSALEHSNRLQHQVSVLQQQLLESQQLLHSLQSQLQLYERVGGATEDPPTVGSGGGQKLSSQELRDVCSELRSLRAQLEHSLQENSSLRAHLEKQLGRSVAPVEIHRSGAPRDGSCRKQLFHDHVPSPPVRDTGAFNTGSTYSSSSKASELDNPKVMADETHPVLEGGAPDGSFASKKGRHTIGHVDDFRALQQQILEGKVLVHKMESLLQAAFSNALLEVSSVKALDYSCIGSLLSNTKTLGQILDEATSLLKMFWRAALPSSETSTQHDKKEKTMKEEIRQLRKKIAEQDELLQETAERLQNSDRTKQSMEHFITSQLSRTRDVLKKARTNLEKNELRISSLSSSSSSPCSGEIPRRPSEAPPGWGFLSTRPLTSARGGRYQCTTNRLQLATH